MKIVQINTVPNGSTGKIMISIHNKLKENKYDSYVVWGRGRKNKERNEINFYSKTGAFFHRIYSHITSKQGFASTNATKKLIKKINDINPDIIHLHNIHGSYINIELLFNYIRNNKKKVIWTFHDCWAFTGHCAYFTYINCNKWQKECNNCLQIREHQNMYLIDNSKWNYKKKKELFTNLNITIVTPSEWLASLVKKSFLKDYNVKVINNGINTNIFKPTPSDFREKYNIKEKKIILGVASGWAKSKGLNDFIKLSEILDDNYAIVIVGVSQTQIDTLPEKFICINKTENQTQLAEIYTAADILFNPTYEDNYPTVNLESIACGTPVLTYDTGGSIEFVKFIKNRNIKFVIEKEKVFNNINILKEYIDEIINCNDFEVEDLSYLKEETMIKEYLKLYEEENKKI